MSDEQRPESKVTVITYDRGGSLTWVEELTDEQFRRRQVPPARSEGSPAFRFEHDPAVGVFRLTAADGTVEVFRNNPTRYLCVEPDPETGAMRPVTERGRPVYLYLCREEREVR